MQRYCSGFRESQLASISSSIKCSHNAHEFPYNLEYIQHAIKIQIKQALTKRGRSYMLECESNVGLVGCGMRDDPFLGCWD